MKGLEHIPSIRGCAKRACPLQCTRFSGMQTRYVEMKRDGINIATDVMLPTLSIQRDAKLPAVFFQTRCADVWPLPPPFEHPAKPASCSQLFARMQRSRDRYRRSMPWAHSHVRCAEQSTQLNRIRL